MTIKTRVELKTYFNTGDIPLETQFIDLIDSLAMQDEIITVAATTEVLTAKAALVAVDHTATAPVTIDLPSAALMLAIGGEIEITDSGANSSVNNITVDRIGSDTITSATTGNTSLTIATDGETIRLRAINATTWKVL